MHKLQMYEDLRDMLEREVKEIEKKGDLDVQSLDNLYKLMTAIQVTDKCIEREEGGGQQSQQGGGQSGNSSRASYGYSGAYANGYANDMSNDYSRMMPYPYAMGNSNGSYERGRSNESRAYESRAYDSSNDGMSNARRGRDGDSDGRYNESRESRESRENRESRESRDSFRNSQDRGRSYENTYEYSRDASKKKMVQKLETLMDDTMSEKERQAIMDCIDKIK